MTGWEEMVNQVCVAGRPAHVKALAMDWQNVFTNARSLSESIDDGVKDLKESWTGTAADDYFGKLKSIGKAIEQIETNHKDIIPMLQDCAVALQKAQTTMPVPDYMLDNVQGRYDALSAADKAYTAGLAGGLLGGGNVAVGISSGIWLSNTDFMDSLSHSFIGDWTRETLGHVTSWFDDQTDDARKIYDECDGAYTTADVVTPSSTPVNPPVSLPSNQFPTSPGGPSPSSLSSTPDLGKSDFSPSSLDPNSTKYGYDPTAGTATGFDPGAAGGFNPDDPPLASLAGTGGDLGGLGGPGGLSGLGGGGGGLSGLGAGGLGAGAGAQVGRPVSLPGGMPMGGAAGAGRGGAAAGKRGSGVMGGGGHGAGGHAPDDERGTWLTEDEDPWGGDTDAPPSVLS